MKSSAHPRASDDEAIEAMAAAWLAQRDDELSPAEAADFARWRTADPRHEAAVERLERAWTALGQLRDFRPEAVRHPERDLLHSRRRSRARLLPFQAIAGAALAAALAVASIWWAGRPTGRPDERRQHHATTADGYERVLLADGSVLELNAATEVIVQFTGSERLAQLLAGEAHFTVAKDRARPFRVDAGAVAVRAVGTAFNVRLATGGVEVLVTEGKVEVAGRGSAPHSRGQRAASATQTATPAAPTPLLLAASERVVIPGPAAPATAVLQPAPAVERLGPDALRAALAWQTPRLVFLDTPLTDAVAQFNRRNAVQLEIADAELARLPIGGSFRADQVDAFVRLLASGGDIAVEHPDTNRVLLRRAK